MIFIGSNSNHNKNACYNSNSISCEDVWFPNNLKDLLKMRCFLTTPSPPPTSFAKCNIGFLLLSQVKVWIKRQSLKCHYHHYMVHSWKSSAGENKVWARFDISNSIRAHIALIYIAIFFSILLLLRSIWFGSFNDCHSAASVQNVCMCFHVLW